MRGAGRPALRPAPLPCAPRPSAVVPENFALPKQDIIALAQATPSLSTLVSAIVTAKLVPALQCTAQQCNPFTVFAPNNAAFAKLPSTLLSYLLAHPPQLAQVLFYHLLDHRICERRQSRGARPRPPAGPPAPRAVPLQTRRRSTTSSTSRRSTTRRSSSSCLAARVRGWRALSLGADRVDRTCTALACYRSAHQWQLDGPDCRRPGRERRRAHH